MRFLLISLCGLVVLAQAAPLSSDFAEEWRLFKAIHGKEYDNNEVEAIRMNIYLENKNKIEKHNEDFRKNLVSYTLGINKFADMLPSEIAAFKGLKLPETLPESTASFIMTDSSSLPSSVDWRTKGVVTGVKNQGGCGSCWAFSATGSLEGQLAIKTGKLVSLSEQQILDCDHLNNDDGCKGGLMRSAFEYIKEAGIESGKDYPYTILTFDWGIVGKCAYDASKVVTKVDGFVAIKNGSEEALKQAVATVGPVSVAIDADASFQQYASGVYNNPGCSSTDLDHGVLAVGYGTTSEGVDYWLVKNSWGADWGDHGYIKMSRNKNNQCGIATMASYPIV